MLGQNQTIRHKNQAAVKITIVGQEPFHGVVFLSVGDRLIDLLNDDRAFIPIKKEGGPAIIVSKLQIASIVELEIAKPAEDIEEEQVEDLSAEFETDSEKGESKTPRAIRKFDPYATLRITPEASVDEIRAAYKTRIKAVHPDSIAALGLDDDLADAALKSTQKINYAYRKIMRDREEAASAEAAPKAAAGSI
ncbi:MAG: J domain-containing protein [Marinicaulis sp.]|nr:J domain-containing protein [Marinicaulis sp.]NNE40510.1 J domain-containing protein [Marinicaulis sp.]NNL89534.1 J domain-containing protein [Marinicaulis sp.]